MLVLVNLNTYLGGGETLLVRMASYLKSETIPFCIICANNSYIYNDLVKRSIANIITVDSVKSDFYYKCEKERNSIVSELAEKLPESDRYAFVTFCMRDLYVITQLTKVEKESKIIHLVLHYQDNFYLCQSLFDKICKVLFHIEVYSRKKQIKFNQNLINKLCENNAIIPMSNLMVKFWNNKFDINLSYKYVVPLPTYDFPETKITIPHNNHKILFIGRIVDFKIPGLCVMLNFINRHKEYSFTVVGDGNKKVIDRYIEKKGIDTKRINFIGQIEYSELGKIIKQHSIGYAMGTSIIEICRYGIPTIMALSAPKHRLFKKDICGGLFVNGVKGNVGDNLFAGESEVNQPMLEDVMKNLELNYDNAATECYEYVKREYGLTRNIKKYISIINEAHSTNFSGFSIPKPSKLRKYFHSKII